MDKETISVSGDSWDKGNRKIIVECDNESVVHFALGLREPPGHVKTLIGRIKGLSRRDWEVKAMHMFREANCCADFLANRALSFLWEACFAGTYTIDVGTAFA
ncbi:hypothetical protein GH714_017729 [Hevea brasiliensis]|uniref:RNase H type-1 domain-containing protein n=1 Tax=Hevea brasiliensis TaxID=3981 RepID=A0A6A6LAR3_HEVBR|nr:hypothetical protein GH714_017729 [Hevea brasiliensis]